jgi:hypothetical protein
MEVEYNRKWKWNWRWIKELEPCRVPLPPLVQCNFLTGRAPRNQVLEKWKWPTLQGHGAKEC